MRHQLINRIVLSALVVTGLTLACDQPTTHNPAAPSVPTLNALDINGPASITPGQQAQLSANLHLADGTVKTSSAEGSVAWRSSNPAVLGVNATGLVTPVASQGEATITAELRLGGGPLRQGSREFVVLPPGTFRLVGRITEEGGPAAITIAGARVEVASGSPFAISDVSGNYRLYGVPPAADIRVSASAYTTQTYPVQLTANSTRNFTLALSGPRPSIAGDYTLFIDANGGCSSSLTSTLQHRSYLATITQSDATLDVALTEPRFNVDGSGHGNHFAGGATGGGATFKLDAFVPYYFYYYYGPAQYPSVVERLPDGRHLVVYGTAVTTASSSGLSGTMTSGGMVLYDSHFPNGAFLGSCFGTQLFRLDRR